MVTSKPRVANAPVAFAVMNGACGPWICQSDEDRHEVVLLWSGTLTHHSDRIRRKMSSGRSGVPVMRAPKLHKASSTAAVSAAGGARAPASPTPFTPSGLSGLGVTRLVIFIGGTCSAVGIAYSRKD